MKSGTMVSAGRNPIWIALLVLLALAATRPALGQTLSLDQAHAGAFQVGGSAEPGSGPITIYNTTYDAWAPIGQGNSMDVNGIFAVHLDPPPKLGDTILAEDALGRQSAEIEVLEPWDPTSGEPPQ